VTPATGLAACDDRALGTSLRLVVTRPGRLAEARRAVDRVVGDVDAACSRFREDSELSRLCAGSGGEVRVSPLLLTALGAALRAARLSGGAVDPTVGTAVRALGYAGDFATVVRDGGPIPLVARRVPGWRSVRLNRVAGSVAVPRGVELDLGSTAKALASDLAARAALAVMAGGGVLVSLGGDIAVAGEPPAGGWRIQVADDSEAVLSEDAETVAVHSGGVATSSTTVRRWTRGGIVLHHIVDPATGLPADGPWRTVSAAAADCLDANIAATAAIVRGAAAVPWLEATGVAARLLGRSGEVVRLNGWPGPPS
jgi:FAD:protein FMN transferase